MSVTFFTGKLRKKQGNTHCKSLKYEVMKCKQYASTDVFILQIYLKFIHSDYICEDHKIDLKCGKSCKALT